MTTLRLCYNGPVATTPGGQGHTERTCRTGAALSGTVRQRGTRGGPGTPGGKPRCADPWLSSASPSPPSSWGGGLRPAAGRRAGPAIGPSAGSASTGLGGPRDAGSSGGGGLATFNVRCDSSHIAPDDPIVHPNMAGMSHLHQFFGNRTTNAASTAQSLRGQATTCSARRRQLRLLGPDAVPERRRRPGPVRADLLPRRLAPELRGHPALPARPADDRRQRHGHRAPAHGRRGLDVPGHGQPVAGSTELRRRHPRPPDPLPRLLGRPQPGLGGPQEPHGLHGQRRLPRATTRCPSRCSSSTSATRRSATPA